MQSYEKLGAFYLGRRYDADQGRVGPEPLLYDAKDLTTHAVCVGMTGSGKTGLCVTLLEEAAIDGIPALAIDPKGDLGNLLLTFPELRPSDFRPWIDEGDATRHGRTPDEEASWIAERWRKGLAEWDQDGERISRLREAVDAVLYTPGSSAGRQLQVLRSFAAPPPALREDADALRERISASVSGLLTLLGVDADPIRSREHILLSLIVESAWREGRGLDLPTLIRSLQDPGVERVGVMDLESFYPASDRFALAMRLNSLLASPGFAAWMEGEPLDVARLLYTPEGRPRIAILSIAHLSDPERMFFVTLLLNEVVAWMRTQPGTQSLRALLYMDEVFGFFPPTANPPSKLPMLTLLKQARAYGLGVVLATQNPVDLDYKGLSNAGTWFLGRLQTERDKARVIEGLEGASATSGARFDRARMERLLAGLSSRVFLMSNVHEDEPTLFHTRWALSYLRGPLTREQIRRLTEPLRAAAPSAPKPAREAPPAEPEPKPAKVERPVLEPGIEEGFLQPPGRLPARDSLLYRPGLLGVASLHYSDSRKDIETWETVAFATPLEETGAGSPWPGSREVEAGLPLDSEPLAGGRFGTLPASATRATSYGRWAKMLKSHCYRERPLRLLRCKELKQVSGVGESEGSFRAQLRQVLHERRDLAVEKLRKRYAPKLARVAEKIRRAEVRVEREKGQLQQEKMQTAISVGATVLGALFGRKLGSLGKATTAARGAGRSMRQQDDVSQALEELEVLRTKLSEMEAEFESELEELRGGFEAEDLEIEEILVRPRKTDLNVDRICLLWTPWSVDADGIATQLVEG